MCPATKEAEYCKVQLPVQHLLLDNAKNVTFKPGRTLSLLLLMTIASSSPVKRCQCMCIFQKIGAEGTFCMCTRYRLFTSGCGVEGRAPSICILWSLYMYTFSVEWVAIVYTFCAIFVIRNKMLCGMVVGIYTLRSLCMYTFSAMGGTKELRRANQFPAQKHHFFKAKTQMIHDIGRWQSCTWTLLVKGSWRAVDIRWKCLHLRRYCVWLVYVPIKAVNTNQKCSVAWLSSYIFLWSLYMYTFSSGWLAILYTFCVISGVISSTKEISETFDWCFVAISASFEITLWL